MHQLALSLHNLLLWTQDDGFQFKLSILLKQ